MAYLYRHIRHDKNEVFYIGIGIKKNYERAYDTSNRNKYWRNVVSVSDYTVEILFDDIDRNFACKKEIEFIELYGRKLFGNGTLVNMTKGGDGGGKDGIKQSKEHIEKRAISRRGVKSSEETKNKIRLANLGKKQSAKTIEKRVSKIRGVKRFDMTEERKEKISNSLKGVKLSHDRIEKMKDRCLGMQIRLGIKNSETHNKILSESNVIYNYKILCPNGDIAYTSNLSVFSKEHFLNANFIYTLKGKTPSGYPVNHSKGFKILSKELNPLFHKAKLRL